MKFTGLDAFPEPLDIPLAGFRFIHQEDLRDALKLSVGKRAQAWEKLIKAIPLISKLIQPRFENDNKVSYPPPHLFVIHF